MASCARITDWLPLGFAVAGKFARPVRLLRFERLVRRQLLPPVPDLQ
ncbi:MAG: hypothetical protein RLZ98_3769 [Pseudomonadota bacterium]|jgi:hypothetical protein